MPRLVIVKVGQGPVVLVDVVELVGAVQQPTPSSCVSPGLHASRTLTVLFKIPPLRGLAQKTAAAEVSTRAIDTRTASSRPLMIDG